MALAQRALTGIATQELLQETVSAVAQVTGADFTAALELLPDKLIIKAGTGWDEGIVGTVTFP